MQNNTVQTLIDYIKDLTGQDSAKDVKIVRALNFAVDHYSYLRITSSGKWRWDSRNHTDLPRVTGVASGNKVSIEDELIALEHVEILVDGKYITLQPVDQRDSHEPLDTVYGSSGQPRVYDYDSRHLYLYPSPDTTYTIRLTYSRAHPRFSADNLTQSVGVDPIHEEYIALYASDRLMIGSNDPSRSQIREELQIKQEEIRDMASKMDMDTVRRLKPTVPSVFTRSSRGKRGGHSSGISGVNY